MKILSDSRKQAKEELATEALLQSGFLRIRVTGTSMLPAIWPGDLVHIRRLEQPYPQIGEVILAQGGTGLLVHRVLGCEIQAGRVLIITCGDRHQKPDPPLCTSQILGSVTAIEGARGLRPVPSNRSLRIMASGWILRRSNLLAGLAGRFVAQCRPKENP